MPADLESAWDRLSAIAPEEAARNCLAAYERETGVYTIKSLSAQYVIDPARRTIACAGGSAPNSAGDFADLLPFALLCHMGSARDIPLLNRHVKPEALRGGHHFFKNAHELPLAKVADKYANDPGGFLHRAAELGGRKLGFGHASAELCPLPRIPVTIILWVEDDEFPARADILFDASADYQAALDVLWASALIALRAML